MSILRRHHHGFTLIEMLVTSAVAFLVVGGAIAGFTGFTDRQEVLNTAKELQQVFRSAQSKARVRDVPVGCVSLLSYQVSLTSSSATLKAICGTGGPYTIRTYTFPSGVTLQTPTESTLQFTTLENGVQTSANVPLPNTVSYVVTNGAGISFTFNVSPTGTISNVQ